MSEIVSGKTRTDKLKCLVIDDESIAATGIINYIKRVDFLELEASCFSAIEASYILKKQNIDLMFLDINMPYLSGLEFLESLEKAPLTIFTTAYSEYALDGFRLHVVDYLLKPISFQRFFQATQKALELFQSRIFIQNNERSETEDIFIRQGDSFQRINLHDIVYVETMQNYLKLFMEDCTFIIHQTMRSLEEMLPKESFFRIHKSFLVNISRIDTISGGRLFIKGVELPISRNKKEDLLNLVVYKRLISK
ncbi:MAG: LytTR family DNA-binding domain-containing protein [Tannerella sp.]|jgi:DNA-binding LytR/AlgR family response regulator|nr:LytTR family DNA-binding domain-containing protein [Tannerella sp.]